MQDWTGNSKAIFSCHGASNHSETERETNDYYATPPIATELLLGLETFSTDILEPCCGQGHISKVLEAHGYNVESFDLIDRGYGTGGVDFLQYNETIDKDIITNPPFGIVGQACHGIHRLRPLGRDATRHLSLQFCLHRVPAPPSPCHAALFQLCPYRTHHYPCSAAPLWSATGHCRCREGFRRMDCGQRYSHDGAQLPRVGCRH